MSVADGGTSVKTILNVEDHAPARFLRTRILQRAGFGVDEVDNAADAIERASAASLMLLDIRLPDGDGFTVCEKVKAAHPTLPIVMVTSIYRTAQARRDAFAVGADAFLLEPVEPERLVRMVEGFVTGRFKTGVERPDGAWAITDAAGQILDLTENAAKLLNMSRRGAIGRSLPTFFVEDRPKLLAELLRAAEGVILNREGVIQPRDRRPVRIHIDVGAVPSDLPGGARLRWDLEREEPPAE
jgi:DNA-binding response OmpR family regulator